jgi:hypothetical protein
MIIWSGPWTAIRARISVGSKAGTRVQNRTPLSSTQGDQINCLSILIIFVKQRTYLATLPNEMRWETKEPAGQQRQPALT